MTARQQWTAVLVVIALLATGLAAGIHFLGDELFPLGVGSEAPAFTLKTVDSIPSERSLAEYRGKVVLVNVWATWCEPCKAEMPSIERLHQEFGAQGLTVLAVSVDDPGAEQRIREYVKALGLTFQILHDPRMEMKARYGVTGYPETFVIARDGTIRKKVIGAIDWSSEANRALVRELLGGTTASR